MNYRTKTSIIIILLIIGFCASVVVETSGSPNQIPEIPIITNTKERDYIGGFRLKWQGEGDEFIIYRSRTGPIQALEAYQIGSTDKNSYRDTYNQNGFYYYGVVARIGSEYSPISDSYRIEIKNIFSDWVLSIQIIIIGIVVIGLSLLLGFMIKNRSIRIFRRKQRKISPEQANKIIKTLETTNQIKIKELASNWRINEIELVNFLLDNYEKLPAVKIDGDYIIVESDESINDFITLIDDEFQSWENKLKKKR